MVDSIIENCYKPSLQALSYTFSEDGKTITIYSHAIIGLETIQDLAHKLKLTYKDETILDLANTIDAINEKLRMLVKNKEVHTLSQVASFLRLTENRKSDENSLFRPHRHNDYYLCFVHGHEMTDLGVNLGHIFTLDNLLGKMHTMLTGQYTFICTRLYPKPQLHVEKSQQVSLYGKASCTMFAYEEKQDKREADIAESIRKAVERMAFV
ncbi:MAG: hypothetical protein EPO11_00890 [Gammaproteobacteria bacterium]|nr:MAG: hypothetical protein EPO11_00890 [Gammaproteobacteria bacterium]